MRALIKVAVLATAALALSACQRDEDRMPEDDAAADATANAEAEAEAEANQMMDPVATPSPATGVAKKAETEKAATKQ